MRRATNKGVTLPWQLDSALKNSFMGRKQQKALLEKNGSLPSEYCNMTEPYLVEMTSTKNTVVDDGICPTLTARMGTGGNQVNAVCCVDRAFYNQGVNALYQPQIYDDGTCPTVIARGPAAVCVETVGINGEIAGTLDASYYKGCGMREGKERDVVLAMRDINIFDIRRLTPTECERLQGYPDGWTAIGEAVPKKVEEFDPVTGEKTDEYTEWEYFYTDQNGKRQKASDSARYKALGNSICTPFWYWLTKRISAQYERIATLGSLFDGISGFPLCWGKINGPMSCRWASEIEPFPSAVCRQHFGDEDLGIEGDFYQAIQGKTMTI